MNLSSFYEFLIIFKEKLIIFKSDLKFFEIFKILRYLRRRDEANKSVSNILLKEINLRRTVPKMFTYTKFNF